ncbi:MAG TPA: chorismate mutase [Pyrinomonadaceae bacterium]|nr:chorismate mutase [Pyrinomonadaceae bacterium]
MDIEDWRNEIDAIDMELLRLLNMRARLAVKVGTLKTAASLPLIDPEREAYVLRRVRDANSGPLHDCAVDSLFRHIIKASRNAEQENCGSNTRAVEEVRL